MNPSITRPTDVISLLGTIDPGSKAAGTVTSDYVDMSQVSSICAILKTGLLGTAATVDAKLVQATAQAGTGKKDITGKAITQIVKASGDNVQAEINCFSEELDSDNSFRWVALEVTVGAAASVIDATILGYAHRYNPASDYNIASVAEIIPALA